jgi:hypothetical protein
MCSIVSASGIPDGVGTAWVKCWLYGRSEVVILEVDDLSNCLGKMLLVGKVARDDPYPPTLMRVKS